MLDCWNDNPDQRPTSNAIVDGINRIAGKKKSCLKSKHPLCSTYSLQMKYPFMCADKDTDYMEIQGDCNNQMGEAN